MKACTKCGVEYPLDYYYADKRTADGKRQQCKACTRAYNQSDPAKQSQKKYSTTDKAKARTSKYRASDKYAEVVENYRPKHNESNRKYAKTESGRAVQNKKNSKRRANVLGAKTFPSVHEYVASLYGKPCMYCGATSDTHEHVIPLSRGGDHSEGNIVPACGPCNFSKGGKLLVEWKHR